jgi:peptidoglycan hydrolase-like protein with peptidoglycan-binding domain
MNHAVRAVIALALGLGVAAAAQAQGTNLQGAAPTPQKQTAMPRHIQPVAATTGKLSRQQIREAQQQLKSQGLLKGRINGVMDRRTHLALARFQHQNGLPRTATLDRKTFDRLTGSQAVGVGSSMPAAKPGTPSTNLNGTGGSGSASGTETTNQNMNK